MEMESLILEGRRLSLQKGKRNSRLAEYVVVEQVTSGQKWQVLENTGGRHEATEVISKVKIVFWISISNHKSLTDD